MAHNLAVKALLIKVRHSFCVCRAVALLLLTIVSASAYTWESETEDPEGAVSTNLALFKNTNTGSLIRVGRHVVYFDGLSRETLAWLKDSSLYGGVIPALMNRIMDYGYYLLMEVPYGPALQPLLSFGRFIGLASNASYTLASIKTIWEAGAWHLLPSLGGIIQPLSGISLKKIYFISAGLMGLSYMSSALTQKYSRYSRYNTPVYLSGSAAKHFFVKAIFSGHGGQPVYEFTRTSLEPPAPADGSYQALASVLEQLDIDRIYIQPEQNNNLNGLKTFFHDPGLTEPVQISIAGNFGHSADSPWLLQAIFQKHDRRELTSVHSALAPSVIDAITAAYQARLLKSPLQRAASDTFTYSLQSEQAGLAQFVHIENKRSLFTFKNKNHEFLTLSWNDGSWPSLTSVSEGSSESEIKQLWIPFGVGQFLSTELTTRARRIAYKIVDQGIVQLADATGFKSYIDNLRTQYDSLNILKTCDIEQEAQELKQEAIALKQEKIEAIIEQECQMLDQRSKMIVLKLEAIVLKKEKREAIIDLKSKIMVLQQKIQNRENIQVQDMEDIILKGEKRKESLQIVADIIEEARLAHRTNDEVTWSKAAFNIMQQEYLTFEVTAITYAGKVDTAIADAIEAVAKNLQSLRPHFSPPLTLPPSQKDVGEQCSVCYEPFRTLPNTLRRITPCTHIFCTPCIFKVMSSQIAGSLDRSQRNHTIDCPYCRSGIPAMKW